MIAEIFRRIGVQSKTFWKSASATDAKTTPPRSWQWAGAAGGLTQTRKRAISSRRPQLREVPAAAARLKIRGTQKFGASLKALERLGAEFDYSLVGCDIIGVNAFFVRNDWSATSSSRRSRPKIITNPSANASGPMSTL